MVFSSIGNLSAKSVETTVARYLNDIKSSARDFSRRQPAAVEPFSRIVTKHTHQTHCIIGARAQGINDAERLPLALLVNLLGGPSANSLLNVLVREKTGFRTTSKPLTRLTATAASWPSISVATTTTRITASS